MEIIQEEFIKVLKKKNNYEKMKKIVKNVSEKLGKKTKTRN